MTATLAVLGSTGSIGKQTLDVVRSGEIEIAALGSGSSVELLARQAREFRPPLVALADETKASELSELLPAGTELAAGGEAMAFAAETADIVVNGVVGFAGLPVTLAALRAGKRLALANKESLIAAGPLVARALQTPGAELLPVDSEHCAVHQCLRANETLDKPDRLQAVSRIVLTASGGPFRGYPASVLSKVNVTDALAHPTWNMGPKITVDSSTLMNKGLEVIEAHELFGVDYDRIEVVVHPQSVVHSMVEYVDGSLLAQLSPPDMRSCIAYAVFYPDRCPRSYGRIDFEKMSRLDFEPPDIENFRCLSLAYEAGRMGLTAPAALNAANEVAVEAFLGGAIGWKAIAEVVEATLDLIPLPAPDSLEAVLNVDADARAAAGGLVSRGAAA